LALLASAVSSGVPSNHGHKEREADGAYSPRSSKHADGQHEGQFDHEAILGSHKEAEEFDDLPPAEAKRRLAKLLVQMDRDADERISRQELKQWILRSFRSLAEEESKERFEDADGDDDGHVTWDEYKEEEFDLEDAGQNEEALLEDPDRAEEFNMLQEDKILFKAADRNDDSKLDKTECLSFSHPEEDPAMYDVVLRQSLSQRDKNGDGFIDFQEYVGERGKDHSLEWVRAEKERFDADLDKDKDGKMNREEILAWMIPSNEDMAEEEVKHLFAGSDDDVDGQLTFDEVLNHHDVFVGSEATDYGDMLHKMGKDEL